MECSSDELSELSDADVGDYAKKSYMYMKSGKLVVRFGTDRFTCPFCTGRKTKQEYSYSDMLKHAIDLGAPKHAAKVKANHQALADHLKTDHADAATSSSMPVRQAEALI